MRGSAHLALVYTAPPTCSSYWVTRGVGSLHTWYQEEHFIAGSKGSRVISYLMTKGVVLSKPGIKRSRIISNLVSRGTGSFHS